MLYNIPIESIEWRYSKQWNEWFPRAFEQHGVEYCNFYPKPLSNEIKHGSFLDVCVTNHFKALQLSYIADWMYREKVKDGDIFFFHDLWFPGIEMLAYMRDGLGIDFKICGILHAGTWDEYDFLTKKGMKRWAEWIEVGWINNIFDAIFVATQFHKDLIHESRIVGHEGKEAKIHVTGLPIYPEFIEPVDKKRDIVVFPHRLDPEKNPHSFFDMANRMPRQIIEKWLFYSTAQLCKTKADYYKILNESDISVSFADQETWGIAMIESVLCGCIPLVPNRLSYEELYPSEFRFINKKHCQDMLLKLITDKQYYKAMEQLRYFLATKFIKMGHRAIPNMLEIMEQL